MTNEELVSLIKNGDDPDKNLAQLFQQNRGMLAQLAYEIGGESEQDDLIQEGYFGLIKAVAKWKPEGGASFATYARHWIRCVMTRYARNNALISVPEYRKDVFVSIRSFEEEIYDDITLEDTIPDPVNGIEQAQERIEQEELSAILWGTVEDLGPDESKVLKMRFREESTLKECGEALGVSTEHARRIEQKALKKMRGFRIRKKLEPFVEENAYSISLKSGLNSFRYTGISSTERAAFYLQDQREHQAK